MLDQNPYSSPTPIDTIEPDKLPLESDATERRSFRLSHEPQWKTDRGIGIVLAIACGASCLATFVDPQAQWAMIGISGLLSGYFFFRSSMRIEKPY